MSPTQLPQPPPLPRSNFNISLSYSRYICLFQHEITYMNYQNNFYPTSRVPQRPQPVRHSRLQSTLLSFCYTNQGLSVRENGGMQWWAVCTANGTGGERTTMHETSGCDLATSGCETTMSGCVSCSESLRAGTCQIVGKHRAGIFYTRLMGTGNAVGRNQPLLLPHHRSR